MSVEKAPWAVTLGQRYTIMFDKCERQQADGWFGEEVFVIATPEFSDGNEVNLLSFSIQIGGEMVPHAPVCEYLYCFLDFVAEVGAPSRRADIDTFNVIGLEYAGSINDVNAVANELFKFYIPYTSVAFIAIGIGGAENQPLLAGTRLRITCGEESREYNGVGYVLLKDYLSPSCNIEFQPKTDNPENYVWRLFFIPVTEFLHAIIHVYKCVFGLPPISEGGGEVVLRSRVRARQQPVSSRRPVGQEAPKGSYSDLGIYVPFYLQTLEALENGFKEYSARKCRSAIIYTIPWPIPVTDGVYPALIGFTL